ncbi:MAG: phosphatidate cytidylyltransferase [Rubrivivax sp.]|jgi:phosphatidate cytidylyltransferase|nr:phosphatidate cytidylyltransferase [Rubrivivax sp.]
MALLDPLRALGPEQQVGLLFVVLFGLLALTSTALAVQGLRRGDLETGEHGRRLWRDLRALWVGSSLFWLAWVSGPAGATLLFGALSFLALREFVTLAPTRRGDHRSLLLAFFAVLPVQYLAVALGWVEAFGVFIPVFAFLALPVASALAGDPERFLERCAKIQWGIMVCVYGLSHAPALLLLEGRRYDGRGAFVLFFLVVVAAAAQIVQEVLSRWLRRRPIARRIDRTFSWRGWLAGVLAGTVAGLALAWITPFSTLQAMVLAGIAAGAGTLGEFVMKALKKDAGVRHWGNTASVTGAVGLLDRIAPLAFAAPVFFHSLGWVVSKLP